MGNKADRSILVVIALFQLGVSSLLLFMQFIAYGGGFQPVSTPFRLSGIIPAFYLFTARPSAAFLFASVASDVCDLDFSVVFPGAAGSIQFRPIFCSCFLLMFISLIYLAASWMQEFAQRGWSWSAWMGWK